MTNPATNPMTTTGALHGAGLTDVRMMVSIHRVFRRELALAVPGIRAVPDGDQKRSGVLADHVALVAAGLHTHHTHEDHMLWEVLEQRIPDELEPLVDLMEEQHAVVADLGGRLGSLLETWRHTASATDRDALADVLDRLVAAMCEHLDDEESRVLPLMARHLTQDEWDAFARAGHESTEKRFALVMLGMMLYEGDPDTMAAELSSAPAPARLIGPPMARRAYRRYARRVHGTATPQRGLGLRPAAF